VHFTPVKKLVAALAVLAAVPQDSATTQVQPFNWPAGTVALVETEYAREMNDGFTTRPLAVLRMTHRMRVSPHPDGLLVQFDNQKAITAAGDMADALGALLPWWVPRIIVGRDGHLVRIEQTERVQELVGQVFEPLATTPTEQTQAALKDLLAIMASGAGLRSLVQDDWDHLVGKWIAAPLDSAPLESTAVSMVLNNIQLRSTVRRQMIDRATCMREDATIECATLESRSVMDRESLPVLQNFLSPGAANAGVRIVGSERVDRVTLETGTMLPHEAILTRTVQSTTELSGRTVSTQNVQRRSVRFTYVSAQ
jgi:hypothetical protein